MRRAWCILLLLAGGVQPAWAHSDGGPRRPDTVNRRGVSQDLDFNLWSLHRKGYLSLEKIDAIIEAYKNGSYERDVRLPDDWVGLNYWVDRLGNVHLRVNGPDGKYYASKDPVPLNVDIVKVCLCAPRCKERCKNPVVFIFRDSCRNLMVGPAPKPEKPKPAAVVIREVPKIVERIVERRVEVPVEKIVEKRVEVPVPGPERIVEKEVIKEVPVEVIREVPVREREKSGYYPEAPSKQIRSEAVGNVFLYSLPRITNVNRRKIIIRKDIKPRPENPPDLGQPPGDPRSGMPPRGRVQPGF